jgi:hypothetical protein
MLSLRADKAALEYATLNKCRQALCRVGLKGDGEFDDIV